jgi:RNA polymerase sigma-70 factor, ECF subfamily
VLEVESIEATLGLVARGDTDAFERVFSQLCPRVMQVAYMVLRDHALAEEVAQEVMVEVWRTAALFDPSRAAAVTWAGMIAHRRAVDRVRSSESDRRRDRNCAIEQTLVRAEDDYPGVEEREQAQKVWLALTSLTERQRQCLVLAYYGGYTYRQVADELQLPLGTVKSRIRDGLLLLKAVLGTSQA